MAVKQQKKKLTLRHFARRQQKQVGDMGNLADEHINRHFFRRLERLGNVRRFVAGWILLVFLLMLVVGLQFGAMQNQYRRTAFARGGIFSEGIVGNYSNANPIYATTPVDSAVSRLIFSGLFRYDGNGQIQPDLARDISVDSTEKIYTVKLKDNIYWQDGQPFTANDVVFTYNTIKDPDAKSFLLPSWQGVEVSSSDNRTVTFELKDTLSSFPHSLTNGILPQHILKDVPSDQLRSNDFNTIHPVGTGPFKIDVVEVDSAKKSGTEAKVKNQQIGLTAYDRYNFGRPYLNRYVIKTFADQEALEKAYEDKKINAMLADNNVPNEIMNNSNSDQYNAHIAAQEMVFFKTTNGVLKDSNVRSALALSTNKKQIIDKLGYPLKTIDEPLLSFQLGYDRAFAQKTNDPRAASKILDKAGWQFNSQTGIREKNKTQLKFTLTSADSSEYRAIAESLKEQWEQIGVEVELSFLDDIDLKATLSRHDYDALIYAISTGSDPDVFAYWHSSQADQRSLTRLNFSEYNSAVADESLKAGRSRSEPTIRALKYKPFLKAWQNDNPALALFQPRLVFVVREPFDGFNSKTLITSVDRYVDVNFWSVRQEKHDE